MAAASGSTCTSPPTSSSRINLVERWFAELTNRKLRRSAHRSVTDWSRHPQVDQRLVQRPRPYVWTKTADEILDTRAPYLPANSSNSGHF